MPTFDVVDQTYLVAHPARVRAMVGSPTTWPAWWSGWLLTVTEDRGESGVRWLVSRPVLGTMELWLEQLPEGTLVHLFLRAEPLAGTSRLGRQPARFTADLARQWKAQMWALKDALEAGRPPGHPR